MAKKKQRKNNYINNSLYLTELKGLMLVIIAIIGLFSFGNASLFVRMIFVFLVGEWWWFFLLLLLVCGVSQIINRQRVKLFSNKYKKFYTILVLLIIISHLSCLKNIIAVDNFGLIEGTNKVVSEFVSNILDCWYDGLSFSTTNLGGGIIGAVLASILVSFFSYDGAVILVTIFSVCIIVMIIGLSIYDKIIKEKKNKLVSSENPDNEKAIAVAREPEEADNRLVIPRVELHQPKVETVVDEETGEVIDVEVFEEATNWEYPPLTLLSKTSKNSNKENQDVIKKNIPILEQVLRDFGIESKVVRAKVGPIITRYELELANINFLNKVKKLDKELSLSLSVQSVDIITPIPGKNTVGIDVANKFSSDVNIRSLLCDMNESDKDLEKKLLFIIGKDMIGNNCYDEISHLIHILITGSTGSGKSIFIHSILASILMRTKPDEVKLVLVDPKKVELSVYNGVPHLLTPVVADPKKANTVLQKIVVEMENRYEIFERSGTKNITSYNNHLKKENETKTESEQAKLMPYIVVIIDEISDLMTVASEMVEESIVKLAKKAHLAGIHLIISTQLPTYDIITTKMKACIPTRISFDLTSGIESKIVSIEGAEKLLGKGDMLFLPQGVNTPIRIQGTFISEEETKAIVDFVCAQQKANYDKSLEQMPEEAHAITGVEGNSDAFDEPLYDEIVDFVVEQGKASTSLIQRRFRLGYNRAERCIDLLEERGIVGPQNGSRPREVLVKFGDNDSEE